MRNAEEEAKENNNRQRRTTKKEQERCAQAATDRQPDFMRGPNADFSTAELARHLEHTSCQLLHREQDESETQDESERPDWREGQDCSSKI